eukprot:TRINITY_DN112507_c0_g1_i1.p1 TRINITY_DN112507_c0_g1~~TRINITY_DN112507_c0_g1_i1.p1  ORF type:complete len:678 (-),score=58.93 TRINITY_DN112507_c0_g1_i1:123-2156(-)
MIPKEITISSLVLVLLGTLYSYSTNKNNVRQQHNDITDVTLDSTFTAFRNNSMSLSDMKAVIKQYLDSRMELPLADPLTCQGGPLPDIDPRVAFFIALNQCEWGCKFAAVPRLFVCKELELARTLFTKRDDNESDDVHQYTTRFPSNGFANLFPEGEATSETDSPAADTITQYWMEQWYEPALNASVARRQENLPYIVPTKRALQWHLLWHSPLNLVDGSWSGSPPWQGAITDSLAHTLYEIQNEELGHSGDRHVRLPSEHKQHPYLYSQLLSQAGLPTPKPVSSLAFLADYPREAFHIAALAAAGSQLNITILAGFALSMELVQPPKNLFIARSLAARGIDPTYYTLHFAADNPISGHGAQLLKAVGKYLATVYMERGREAAVEEFHQMYAGFVAFNRHQTDVLRLRTEVGEEPTWWENWGIANTTEFEHALNTTVKIGRKRCRDRPKLPLPTEKFVYTMDEVDHYSLVVIRGAVLDLCFWLEYHPGEQVNAIYRWLGKDATPAFSVLHSFNWKVAAHFQVGILDEVGQTNSSLGTSHLAHNKGDGLGDINHQYLGLNATRAHSDMVDMLTPFFNSEKLQLFHPKQAQTMHVLLENSEGNVELFLEGLKTSEYVNQTHPNHSRLLFATEWHHPMHSVLDREVVHNWLWAVAASSNADAGPTTSETPNSDQHQIDKL